MKKGLLKGLIILTMVTAVVSLAGCNRKEPEPKPIDPPTQEEETQNVQLLAPTISVSPELVLQINPNSDSKTQEKTTGYEVTINGETQILTKDELSLQLELAPGDDVIEVKAIGGEKTESKQVATITVTEEQKASITYNEANEILLNVINEKLEEKAEASVEVQKIIGVYQENGNLVADVLFGVDGYDVTFFQKIQFQSVIDNDYNNVFDFYNLMQDENIKEKIKDFTVENVQNSQKTFGGLIENSYLSTSELSTYLNDGWTPIVLHEDMGTILTASGNFYGLEGYHRYNTKVIIKLEKDGAEDIYLNTSYRVSIDRSYDKSTLIESIANGTIEASDIIIDNETVTVLEKANIYQDAKEAYEGNTAETIHGQVQEAAMTMKTSTGETVKIILPDNGLSF